jgi:hypothetical protein
VAEALEKVPKSDIKRLKSFQRVCSTILHTNHSIALRGD